MKRLGSIDYSIQIPIDIGFSVYPMAAICYISLFNRKLYLLIVRIDKGRVLHCKNENRITSKTLGADEIDMRVLRGYATKPET